MKYSNLKAIILGADGYIGSNLCAYLLSQNIAVESYGRKSNIDFIDTNSLKKINFSKFDLIFIMIGKTGTADGFENHKEYIESNQIVLLNILNQCVNQNFEGKIVYPSTRLVYKGIVKTPLKEDATQEAKTIYAATKIFAENVLHAWGNLYGIRYTTYRICVPYGHIQQGDYSYGTMGFLTQQAREKKKITLFGNGEIYRTFTHVEDICKIMLEGSMIKQSDNQTFNIGSEDNISLNKLANMLCNKYNAEIEYLPWTDKYKKLESGDTIFDDAKLKKLMKIEYKNNLTEYVSQL